MKSSPEYLALKTAYLSGSADHYEEARAILDQLIMDDESDIYFKTEDLLAATYSESVNFGDWVTVMLMTLATEREDVEIGNHVGRLFAIPLVSKAAIQTEAVTPIRERTAEAIQAVLAEAYVPEEVTVRVQPFLLSIEGIQNSGWVSVSRMLSVLHEGGKYNPLQYQGSASNSRVWYLIVYAESHIIDEEAMDDLQVAFSPEHYQIITRMINQDTAMSPHYHEQLCGMAPLDTAYLIMQEYDRKLRMTTYLESNANVAHMLRVNKKTFINGDSLIDLHFAGGSAFQWDRSVGEDPADALHAFNKYLVALMSNENLPDRNQIH